MYNILHMLILPTNAQDWHLHLHIRAYLNKPLGLQATSGSWKENKPTFWKWSLFSSVPWLWDQMWFSKQWFNHQIQIAQVGFIAFSYHESFRLPHTSIHTTHICLHVYYKLFTWFIPLYYNNNKTNYSSIKHNSICTCLQINEMYTCQLMIKTSSHCL